ncbi:MAG TPA: class II fructose-bisphosphate aldolase [Patescibacteria group bacterium]|jgi:fructose-bisphosphate aldolase class II|nr:class II fructose-bisphosphate aldolase [Patescibacteria group bacterium]
MLVHIKELFKNDPAGSAVVGKFAYPAFNTMNLETTLGIIAAAEELNTPIILETSEGAIKYAGLTTLFEIMASLAVKAKVPIALHMDHGKDMEQLKAGIELGYSSVMIDHSGLSYDENVRDTKAMVEFAHAEGAWVQGEIGRMRGSEDWVSVSEAETLLTEPDEAKKFFDATGVDVLASSVGTIHGVIKMSGKVQAHVDVERIREIHSLVNAPLVLHGASGVPDDVISEAIAAGIAIINIDTELRMGFTRELRTFLASHPDEIDPRKYLNPAIEGVKVAAMKKLKAFKTQNIV